ncbi:MAG: histidine phosphatase family protein [Candidatus Paceibacterota bacterium]
MKTVYFVRHGESEGNAGELTNTDASPLTENGRRQATIIAKRCKRLGIKKIMASTILRAKETGDIISKEISKPIEYSSLFTEAIRPSIAMGKRRGDPEIDKIEAEIRAKFHLSGYRHSDEENFDELKERARKALEQIASCPEDTVLVVTHGVFMKMMLAYALFDETLTGLECRRFMGRIGMDNTGLTVLQYVGKDDERPWRLLVWNDHAHLGEY